MGIVFDGVIAKRYAASNAGPADLRDVVADQLPLNEL
jgi:hypothetical protein